MADTIRTQSTEKKITHYVSFEQGITKLGLVPCNGRGVIDPKALRQGKMPNRSLQISQGDPDYSDMELPYTPITQKDWSGGRGNEDFEKDKSRYSDSNFIDSLSGDVILSGKPVSSTYGSPPTPAINAQQAEERHPNPIIDADGTYHFSLDENNEYIQAVCRGSRFQWNNSFGLSKIKLWLAGTYSVQLVLLKYPTIDLATWLKLTHFNSAIIGMYPAGYTPTDTATLGNFTVVAKNNYTIVNSDTLAEYEFNFPANMENGAYYVLGVNSTKPINPIKAEDFTIDPIFGVNNTKSTLEWYSLNGYFTTRQEGGSTSESSSLFTYTCTLTTSLAYQLEPKVTVPGGAFFLKLKNTEFLVTSPLDGSAPRLFMEGYHGYATDNSTNKMRINAINIGSEALGATVKIVGGTGTTEQIRWRRITKVVTGASGYCEVNIEWNITHDATTEYAIYGTGKWVEITGHGLAAAVTDVMVVNDIVYFVMGEGTDIRRMRFVNTAQVWTPEYANETGIKATFLKMIQNENGVQKIWRALQTAATVSSSDVKAWGVALDFGATSITCGNTMYRINGLIAYGTPRIPYVLKEDGFGAIANNIYDQVPLAEFATVSDDNNGRANLQRGHYLYLSMLNGIERYYEGRLDDIGMNRDQGLPNDRNGHVSHMLAYPGRMYAAVDHQTGYSSVMVYNDIGWHEIYRSPMAARIYSMSVQVIDGDVCDRLWIAHEGGFTWIPIAIDPRKQSDYQYNSSGEVVSSWISGNFKEIKKYFSSIVVYSEGLSTGQYVKIGYQLDNEDNDWQVIETDINESPTKELAFPDHNTAGKRIRIKVMLFTSDPLKSPRIKGITIKPVTRLPMKKAWSLSYRIDDNIFDLQGVQSTLGAYDLQTQIENWADSDSTPTPLLMHAPHTLLDNKYVFIEPDSLSPITWVLDDSGKDMVAIGQLSIFEAE